MFRPETSTPAGLRRLADWYRKFAERAGNPAIWEMRLRTAEVLEAEAFRIEAARSQAGKTDALTRRATEKISHSSTVKS
jgi:hypothetical protein